MYIQYIICGDIDTEPMHPCTKFLIIPNMVGQKIVSMIWKSLKVEKVQQFSHIPLQFTEASQVIFIILSGIVLLTRDLTFLSHHLLRLATNAIKVVAIHEEIRNHHIKSLKLGGRTGSFRPLECFFLFLLFSFSRFCMFGLPVRPLRDLADEMESIAQLQLAGVSNTEEEEARLADSRGKTGGFCWLLVVVAHGID